MQNAENVAKTAINSKPKGKIKRIIIRSFVVILALIVAIVIFLLGIITVLCKGPSPTVRDLFVTTVMETSAAKFLAHMYFSDAEIAEIQNKNSVVVSAEITNTKEEFVKEKDALPLDTIEVEDVSGPTFNGKMMIVHDPSRVVVSTIPEFGKDKNGIKVSDHIKNANGVAGVNAGGFLDEGGVGKGGEPIGVVISNSKIMRINYSAKNQIVGFDKNNKMIIGNLTGKECEELGIRDAVTFGPPFIINGKAAPVSGTGGGLNPRSVIGQREDGAVLILVINGRQATSMGATYEDCINVMMDYKAINACNLDGGSSSILIHNDEILNISSSLYGPRRMPTAIIVK